MNEQYIIWSIEHDGWWAPNKRGYVEKLANAGLYSYEEAFEIVRGANYCLQLEKPPKFDKYMNTPHEAMIFVTAELRKQITS
jgi:hypothetical protein